MFEDATARSDLEAIVHPEVQRLTSEKLVALEQADCSIAIYEAALLVETGLYNTFDGLVVVTVNDAEQLRRLTVRDEMDERQARAMIESQMKTEEKTKVADWVIDNSGSTEQTLVKVQDLWRQWEKEGESIRC